MRRRLWLGALITVGGLLLAAAWAWSYFGPDGREIYRRVHGHALSLAIFRPPGVAASGRVLVLFHGGGWSYGSPWELMPLARLLADAGLVVVLPEYRIRSRHGTGALEALEDAAAAVAWVRDKATLLGVDATDLVLGGASAGGQLAATTALRMPATAVSALVLLAPVTDTSEATLSARRWLLPLFDGRGDEVSPSALVRPRAPATLVLHGQRDRLVPPAMSRSFCARMRQAGNRCELRELPGTGHSFHKLPWHWAAVAEATVGFLARATPPR